MSLRINTNIAAFNSHRNLVNTQGDMSKSLEKLSSGFRINRAADDAAGLAISEQLRTQVRGLNQASSNAQNGISLIQTAEGALNETTAILQRMRELAVQAGNDTLTAQNRTTISDELTQLTGEIDRISGSTQFNTINLLNGGAVATAGLTLQVGANSSTGDTSQAINLKIGTVSTAALTLTAVNVSSATFAAQALASISSAITSVSSTRSGLGAVQNRLEHTIKNLSVASENLAASESRIRDTDMAREMMNFSRSQILSQAGTAMLAQANQVPQGVLSLLR